MHDDLGKLRKQKLLMNELCMQLRIAVVATIYCFVLSLRCCCQMRAVTTQRMTFENNVFRFTVQMSNEKNL